MPWYVYILECADNSLYTGVTTDIKRRLQEHNSGKPAAARYTRARQPVSLRYCETADSRSSACRREAQIKAMTRPQKIRLINARP